MHLLRTAVVDVTTLVATCHALKTGPDEDGKDPQRKLRSRLCSDIKRGTVAYIDALARTRHGVVDDTLLNEGRVAAEQQMPRALAQQELLGHIMSSEAGSLDGMAAARQDLWRLAHVAIHTTWTITRNMEGPGLDALRAGQRVRLTLDHHPAFSVVRAYDPQG